MYQILYLAFAMAKYKIQDMFGIIELMYFMVMGRETLPVTYE